MTQDPKDLFLIRAAMDAQPWERLEDVPTVERYRRALSREEPLTEAEKRQLWLSPAARLHFLTAHEERRDARQAAWVLAGVEASGQALAAAGSGTTASVATRDFTVTVQRDDADPEAPVWLIAVTFSQKVRENLTPGVDAVTLRDSGGLVWLSDVPDETGVLSGLWQHEGSPLERLHSYSMTITPA